jgi:hypothetical protein
MSKFVDIYMYMVFKLLCPKQYNAMHAHLSQLNGVEKIWNEWMIHFLYHCQKIYIHVGTFKHFIKLTIRFLILTSCTYSNELINSFFLGVDS